MREHIHTFLTWLFAAPAQVANTESYSIEDVSDLRARDLRKLLRSFGVEDIETKSILDKDELRQFVVNMMEEDRSNTANSIFRERALKWTIIVLLLTVVYIAKDPILFMGQKFIDYLLGVGYGFRQKYEMSELSYKNSYLLSALALLTAALLDIAQCWIQMSTFLSWVIPYESPARILLFPFQLSLPINASMLIPKKGEMKKQFGDYGMNFGPMIMLTVISYIKDYLQEYGAGRIMEFTKAGKKKTEKREKMQAADAEAESEEKEKEKEKSSETAAAASDDAEEEIEEQRDVNNNSATNTNDVHTNHKIHKIPTVAESIVVDDLD